MNLSRAALLSEMKWALVWPAPSSTTSPPPIFTRVVPSKLFSGAGGMILPLPWYRATNFSWSPRKSLYLRRKGRFERKRPGKKERKLLYLSRKGRFKRKGPAHLRTTVKEPLRKQCRFVLVVTLYAMKLLIPSPT